MCATRAWAIDKLRNSKYIALQNQRKIDQEKEKEKDVKNGLKGKKLKSAVPIVPVPPPQMDQEELIIRYLKLSYYLILC